MENQSNTDFHHKSDFFKGGYFVVNLSLFEAQEKLFIPGHRFIPFLNPSVRPWRIAIKTGKGTILPKIKASATPETLKPFYQLYGDENFLFMLIDDKTENSAIILENAENYNSLFFTAFDLKPLLEEENFTNPLSALSLVFKIDDWEKGAYTIKLKEISGKNSNAGEWISLLEQGFETAMSKRQRLQMVTEIMSNAFLFGGKTLIENPVLSLEDFFEMSEISNIADVLSENREDPLITEKKNFIKEKTLNLIKTFTYWLENTEEDKTDNPGAVKALEKQILMTKKTLIAVLEELNNPFLSEETIDTIMQIITESENLIAKIK